MSVVLDVQHLSRSYGAFRALDDVSFQVSRGEIVGFLGPNGAGKTTTMKILTGFMAPSAGAARVCGLDVVTESLEVRRRIGYLPENAPVYTDMRVVDYLDFVGRMRGMAAGERARAVERVAMECDVEDRLHQPIGELSKGYRQRVGLAQALLHQPEVLILDEPTSGLDPNQIQHVRDLVRRIGRSRTVLLSTHILQEVQAMCDRVLILNRGKLVADSPVDRVQEVVSGGALVRAVFTAGSVRLTREALSASLQSLAGVLRVEAREEEDTALLGFEVLAERDLRAEVFDLAVREGVRLVELTRQGGSLEEVFRRLTVAGPTAPADVPEVSAPDGSP
jgi:ABC-2 type transport system ATP-binding protein